jgi:prepilin-type processing-associated H-X9-DG protein
MSVENYNWTYHILPYMEQNAVYQLWPKNITQLKKSIVGGFLCPSRRQKRLYQSVAKSDYSGSIGTGSNYNGVLVRTSNSKSPRWISFSQMTDGTTNTIMVGESRVHLKFLEGGGCCGDNENLWNSGWADDVLRSAANVPAYDVVSASIASGIVDGQFGSSHPAQMNAVYADGSVRGVSYTIDLTTFQRACIRDDGNP